MENVGSAIDRIKMLQCPTGELENRVMDILEDYNIVNRNEVVIDRAEDLDKDGAQAYMIKIPDGAVQSIVMYAKSGLDDYVARVTNVYIS